MSRIYIHVATISLAGFLAACSTPSPQIVEVTRAVVVTATPRPTPRPTHAARQISPPRPSAQYSDPAYQFVPYLFTGQYTEAVVFLPESEWCYFWSVEGWLQCRTRHYKAIQEMCAAEDWC